MFISKIRNILKKYFPFVYKKTDKLRFFIFKKLSSKKIKVNLIEEFFEFLPGGSGGTDSLNENILYNIKNISNSLISLIDEKKIKNYKDLEFDSKLALRLRELFKQNGSDKHLHSYEYIYSHIFSKFKINKLLEIGIGSQDEKILSNMGNFGKPGGCLRTFSEILGDDSEIVGLEIDKKALFNEKNIKTFEFNQLSIDDIQKFSNDYQDHFDLIIDDGLHSNVSIINSIYLSTKILDKGGILVIEDLFKEQLNFLQIAFGLLTEDFNYEIYYMNKAYLIIANKLS